MQTETVTGGRRPHQGKDSPRLAVVGRIFHLSVVRAFDLVFEVFPTDSSSVLPVGGKIFVTVTVLESEMRLVVRVSRQRSAMSSFL